MPLNLLIAITLAVDTPRVVHLSAPDATLSHEFSQIRGIRELPDGRVLISDRLDEALLLADLGRGTTRAIGRKGTGPAEFRLPGTLLPLPGDSTLLVDEGNSRLAVIAPDFRIARSVSSYRPGMTSGIVPRTTDTAGRLYFEIPPWAQPGADPGDSTIVARWDPRTDKVERLGRIRGITYRTGRVMGIPYVVFAPEDIWQADPTGRIVFVRAAGYRIESRDPISGRMTTGGPTPYRPIPVSARDRTDYVTRFMATSSIGGRGTAGLSAVPADMQTPEAIAKMIGNQEFAAVHPPFTDAVPHMSPDGSVWVERSAPSTAAATIDVFDQRGVRIAAVSLPAGRRLALIATKGVYLISADADGIEHLERYRLPPLH